MVEPDFVVEDQWISLLGLRAPKYDESYIIRCVAAVSDLKPVAVIRPRCINMILIVLWVKDELHFLYQILAEFLIVIFVDQIALLVIGRLIGQHIQLVINYLEESCPFMHLFGCKLAVNEFVPVSNQKL